MNDLPVIGLDLDGVCANFTVAVRDAYLEDYGVLLGESTHWNYILENTHFEAWSDIYAWLKERDHFWLNVPEYEGAREGVKELLDLGYPVVVVTHRPDWGQEDTVAWVERFWPEGYATPTVVLAYDKTTVAFDILIDDGPHNIEAMEGIGRRSLIFDQPWNQGVQESELTLRAEGWSGVLAILVGADIPTESATIIGLSGYAQAGKDSVGRVLVQMYGFERIAFADVLREVLYRLNPVVRHSDGRISRVAKLVDKIGWDQAKQWSEVRKLLQRLGTEAGREVLGQDVWVNAALAQIKPGGKYVITDVRFPNEADAIKAAGGEVWRILRRGEPGAPGTGPANDHPSETALNGYLFDRGIIAGTMRELVNAVVETMDARDGKAVVRV